jgi:hypothetical protein
MKFDHVKNDLGERRLKMGETDEYQEIIDSFRKSYDETKN